jgi:hypothetical protein
VSSPGAGGERSEPPLMIVKNILTASGAELQELSSDRVGIALA